MVVIEGEKLHLKIPYQAIPTPKIMWQKETVECKADDRLSMTLEMNSAHLELLKCTRADAGAYAISLENELGTATATVNVKVIGTVIVFMFNLKILFSTEHGRLVSNTRLVFWLLQVSLVNVRI